MVDLRIQNPTKRLAPFTSAAGIVILLFLAVLFLAVGGYDQLRQIGSPLETREATAETVFSSDKAARIEFGGLALSSPLEGPEQRPALSEQGSPPVDPRLPDIDIRIREFEASLESYNRAKHGMSLDQELEILRDLQSDRIGIVEDLGSAFGHMEPCPV